MRLLMTADAVGGVWTYSLELCRALAAWNVHVTLVTFGPPPDRARQREADSLPNVRLMRMPRRLEWMDNPWDDVDLAGSWLLDLERDTSPDLVHLNQFSHGALPWRAPVVVVGHSCVFSWWRAVCETSPGAEYREYRRRVAAGLRGADAVATPTAAMMAALERHYGRLHSRHVIPNGRDPAAFRPARKEPMVLTVGRIWDRGKNMMALERAAADLEWPVYAVGPVRHPDGGEVRTGHLTCLGSMGTVGVARWLRRAGIYAHPALYEPFGLCVLEAALSGCALVLSDIPSLRELWAGCAIFVPPHDPDRLSAALHRLIERPVWRRELGRRARHRALRYAPARMAEDYMRLYLDLQGRRSIAGRSDLERQTPALPLGRRSAVG